MTAKGKARQRDEGGPPEGGPYEGRNRKADPSGHRTSSNCRGAAMSLSRRRAAAERTLSAKTKPRAPSTAHTVCATPGSFQDDGEKIKATTPIRRFIPPSPQDGTEWAFPGKARAGRGPAPTRQRRSRSFRSTNIFRVPRGRDVFKSPQGCSRTHPVGKDETTRPVDRAHRVRDTRFVSG